MNALKPCSPPVHVHHHPLSAGRAVFSTHDFSCRHGATSPAQAGCGGGWEEEEEEEEEGRRSLILITSGAYFENGHLGILARLAREPQEGLAEVSLSFNLPFYSS